MSNDQGLSRFFNGCCDGNLFGNGGFLIIVIIGAILLLGEDLIEWLFCNDMILIWVVLLILLLTCFDFDNDCCC